MRKTLRDLLLWADTKNGRWITAAAIVVIAMVLNVAVVWNLPITPLHPDCEEYWHLAHNLRTYGTYGFTPDWKDNPALATSPWRPLYDASGMCRPPGYPVVLAGLESLLGPDLRASQAVFVVIEAISVLGIYLLTTFLFGRLAGLLAALLSMVDPGVLDYITKFGREPFIALFVVFGVYLSVRSIREKSWAFAIAAGVCFGLGAYFKETLAMAGMLVAAWMIGVAVWQRAPVWRALAIVACLGLIVAPWVIRNSFAHHQIVGFSTISGYAVNLGIVDPQWFKRHPAQTQGERDPFKATDSVEADRRYRARVIAYVKDQPFGALRAMWRNVGHYWSPVPLKTLKTGVWSVTAIFALIYYGLLYGIGAASLWKLRRRSEAWLALILIGGMTLTHSLCVSWPRYRVPFNSLLLVFAAGLLAAWIAQWLSRGSAAPTISGTDARK